MGRSPAEPRSEAQVSTAEYAVRRNQRSLTAEITKIAEEDKAESLQQIRLFAACE